MTEKSLYRFYKLLDLTKQFERGYHFVKSSFNCIASLTNTSKDWWHYFDSFKLFFTFLIVLFVAAVFRSLQDSLSTLLVLASIFVANLGQLVVISTSSEIVNPSCDQN